MQIRPERDGDAEAIGLLTTAAFRDAPHSAGTEAAIVAALRAAGALAVSLVATGEESDAIIGHIAFSRVVIGGRPGASLGGEWYGLGPISVDPDHQRRGIGGALIAAGLERLETLGAGGCVLLGDPRFYGRFGFVSDPALTYDGEPSPYLQRRLSSGDPPSGEVAFHPGFDAQ